jgi:hypothetical protein
MRWLLAGPMANPSRHFSNHQSIRQSTVVNRQ